MAAVTAGAVEFEKITGRIAKIHKRGFMVASPRMMRYSVSLEPALHQVIICPVGVKRVVRILGVPTGPTARLLGHTDDNIGDAHLGDAFAIVKPVAAENVGVEAFGFSEIPAGKT